MLLRRRQPVQALKERDEQLVQCSKGERHLRLDALNASNSKIRRRLDNVIEQSCLADTRLASQDQGSAQSFADRLEQATERLELRATIKQHG